jgi:hypothetical protein
MSAWKQVNAVISPPRRWQTLRLGEDDRELGDRSCIKSSLSMVRMWVPPGASMPRQDTR